MLESERTSVLRRSEQRTGTWQDFVADVGPHVVGDKSGRIVFPYLAPWTDGETHQPRSGIATRPGATTALVSLDLDKENDDAIDTAITRLNERGVAYLAHTTHSNTPEQTKLRIHVPLWRAVPLDQIAGIKDRLSAYLGLKTDRQTRGGHTGFFSPRCSAEMLEHAWLIAQQGPGNGPLYYETLPEVAAPAAGLKVSATERLGERHMRVTPRPLADWPEPVRKAAREELDGLCRWLEQDRGESCRDRLKSGVSLLSGYAASGVLPLAEVQQRVHLALLMRAMHGRDDHPVQYRLDQAFGHNGFVEWGHNRPIIPEGFNAQGLPDANADRSVRSLRAALVKNQPERLYSVADAQRELHTFLRRPRGLQRALGLVEISTGGGKAQPHSEPVLLERGWTPMGEVRPGDRIYGSDGQLHDVLAVHPQGVREVWEVEFSDGTIVRCDADHLWSFHRHSTAQPLVTKTAREWANLPTRRGSGQGRTMFLPELAPIHRPEADLPLDPYTLGLLLGDGGMSGAGVSFTTMDRELVDALVLPPGVSAKPNKNQNSGRATQYSLACSTPMGRLPGGGYASSPLISILRELGLMGTTSHTKHIPAAYAQASATQRLALLQGLFDTDGSWARSNVEYTTTSHALALAVREMVQSLGGRATIAPKQTSWTYKGAKNHSTAWRMNIKLPLGVVPFRVARKVEQFKASKVQSGATRAVVGIRATGHFEPASCISVSAPDRLYVTSGHVLTHNTHTLRQLAKERASRGQHTVILSLDHGLLGQIRRDLQEDNVAVRHLHSLSQPSSKTGSAECLLLKDPDKRKVVLKVVQSGASLMGSVCTKCPVRGNCGAYKARGRKLSEFVIVAPYAMAQSALDKVAQAGGQALVVCDEEPPESGTVQVSEDAVKAMLLNPMVWEMMRSDQTAVVNSLAHLLVDGHPENAPSETLDEGLKYHSQLHLNSPALCDLEKHETDLETARLVLSLIPGWRSLERVALSKGHAWRAPNPNPAWAVLEEEGGFVLSATPNYALYENFPLPVERLQLRIQDNPSTPNPRVVLFTKHATRSKVLPEKVIDWQLVESDLRQLFSLVPADRRMLIGTYKAVSDALKTTHRHLLQGRDIELTHYEVVRGRDDWRGRDVFVSLYDPRPPSDSFAAGTAAAARSLEQFHGRARDPQPRERPAVHIHMGTVAPMSWWAGEGVGDGRCEVWLRGPGAPALPLFPEEITALREYAGLEERAAVTLDTWSTSPSTSWTLPPLPTTEQPAPASTALAYAPPCTPSTSSPTMSERILSGLSLAWSPTATSPPLLC